ncbi:hypothetical protein [Psittacicella gerlachiana]|nr:hypothetical protein [Psittacicella gerlachiana]
MKRLRMSTIRPFLKRERRRRITRFMQLHFKEEHNLEALDNL